MNSRPAKKSPYRSQLRAEQAAATRRLVLDAATRLFVERGYAATSIDAIAEAAGVGRSTVFAAAGGKSWLLKTAYDRAIVGDDEPVPLLQRPAARKLFEMSDPAEIVMGHARIVAEAAERVSAICEAIHRAAGCDPEVGDLWAQIGQERLTGAKAFAALISEKGGLRDGLAVGQARDIIWIFNDPTLHHVLVRQRRWSQDRYRDWLTDSLQRQLLG
jgi:AcrR family transcriptional regulator